MKTARFNILKGGTIWIFAGMLCCPSISLGQAPGKSSAPRSFPSTAVDYVPHFARFVTDDPALIVWGDETGLKLYDVEIKSELDRVLEDQRINALSVNPVDLFSGIAATTKGTVIAFRVENRKLSIRRIEPLNRPDIGIIKCFLYNSLNPAMILATDGKRIYSSSDGGNQWDVNLPLNLPDPDPVIITVIQSLYKSDAFLISTTQGGRYMGRWGENNIVAVPEEASPHGYVIERNGMNFILIGGNSNLFTFNHLKIRLLDAVVLYQDQEPVLFGAGIGLSPIIYKKTGKRVYVNDINPRLSLTFSIDVFRKDTARILVTSSSGIFLSLNGGQDWTSIQ